MPEPTLPQLRSLPLCTTGRPLSLRVLLPPNLATLAARGGRIPIKIEALAGDAPLGTPAGHPAAETAPVSTSGQQSTGRTAPATPAMLPPEKLGKGPWQVDAGTFLAALLIESWCDGRIPSMLQLDAAQLSQLLQPLENTESVFWLKAPAQPLRWERGELPEVHPHLRAGALEGNRHAASTRGAAASAHAASRTSGISHPSASPRATGAASAGRAAHAAHAGRASSLSADAVATGSASAGFANATVTDSAGAAGTGSIVGALDGNDFSAFNNRPALPPMERGLMPLEVDGSVNFLALRLPSRESALHPHALALVKEYGFQLEPSNGKWWLRDRHKTLQFLADETDSLRADYQARFTDNFTERTRALRFARIEVDVRSTTPRGNDAFDIELALSAPDLDEAALQQALEKGQHYIEAQPTPARGKAGFYGRDRNAPQPPAAEAGSAFILVPRHVRAQAAYAQQALGASPTQGLRSRFRSRVRKEEVAATQLALQKQGSPFATDTDEPESLATKLPAQWLRLSRALNELDALAPCPAPQPLVESLRPYQRIGAAWLWHLYRNGLGGILADEMGLGKTVQCLTFLAAAAAAEDDHTTIPDGRSGSPVDRSTAPVDRATRRTNHGNAPAGRLARHRKPSLVACPASLVENWRREAAKFTPHLRVFCHHGESRLASSQQAADYDLILTSYGTLARDSQLFEQIEFCVAVGDEAQHIKNAKTQNARALRAVRSSGRFLLTGTPVENDIRELQSLFAFILPGYLAPAGRALRGAHNAAASPADNRTEDRAWLVSRAAPYILRRMKQTVAKDLPEKIEQVIYCELGTAQRAFYRKTQENARRAVQELELGGAAENRVRFAAFTELLRLRQACIDPQLVDEREQQIGSAKREALLELVQEAVEGGHRLLVFSQFTSALKLVAADLDALGLRHFYLDGQTKNRAALCEQFNEDASVSAFLISLRAGGTGLNLTGADTVVHLDPWWNPAAQAQATDRAHRIGQQRIVTVYQLIAAQTVEEQVLTLQREKTALLEQLLDASDAASASIGLDDLKSLIDESA